MDEGHTIDDAADGVQSESGETRRSELVSVVVEEDDAPDQCTIFHPDSSGVDRMSRWITAEADLLVDLYSVR